MGLSVENRLRKATQFDHVLRNASRASSKNRSDAKSRWPAGGRAGDSLLLMSAMPAEAPGLRIGLSVSKKIGQAVVRNRVKRRLREIFRELVVAGGGNSGPGWDVVATARPKAAGVTYEELRNSAHRLFLKVTARQ